MSPSPTRQTLPPQPFPLGGFGGRHSMAALPGAPPLTARAAHAASPQRSGAWSPPCAMRSPRAITFHGSPPPQPASPSAPAPAPRRAATASSFSHLPLSTGVGEFMPGTRRQSTSPSAAAARGPRPAPAAPVQIPPLGLDLQRSFAEQAASGSSEFSPRDSVWKRYFCGREEKLLAVDPFPAPAAAVAGLPAAGHIAGGAADALSTPLPPPPLRAPGVEDVMLRSPKAPDTPAAAAPPPPTPPLAQEPARAELRGLEGALPPRGAPASEAFEETLGSLAVAPASLAPPASMDSSQAARVEVARAEAPRPQPPPDVQICTVDVAELASERPAPERPPAHERPPPHERQRRAVAAAAAGAPAAAPSGRAQAAGLKAVAACAECVSVEDLLELAAVQRPHPTVREVVETALMLLGYRDATWPAARALFERPEAFLEKLRALDASLSVSRLQYHKLCRSLARNTGDAEPAESRCRACAGLERWIRAVGELLAWRYGENGGPAPQRRADEPPPQQQPQPQPEPSPGGGRLPGRAGGGSLGAASSPSGSPRRSGGGTGQVTPSPGVPPTAEGSPAPRPRPALGELELSPDIFALPPHELRRVRDFTIRRPDVGEVTFHGEIDVTLDRRILEDLPSVVRLEAGEVVLYPEPGTKPPEGEGLNRAATITLFGCMPPNNGVFPDAESKARYRERIAQMTEAKGAQFMDYDCDRGIWQFRVDHF